MLGYLKDIFTIILLCLFFAIIRVIIIKYKWSFLRLFLLLQIYKQLFNYLNLIYIISLIRKSRLKNLNFLILSNGFISQKPKIIIFVNIIQKVVKMTKHFCSKLPRCIKKKHLNYIIAIFITTFTTKSKTLFFIEFCLNETQIWIYIYYTSINTNLLDIFCII